MLVPHPHGRCLRVRPPHRAARGWQPPPLAPLQFGPGAMQQHGFARNLDWDIASSSADAQPDDRDPEVTLMLTDNDYTRAMWCAGRWWGVGGWVVK